MKTAENILYRSQWNPDTQMHELLSHIPVSLPPQRTMSDHRTRNPKPPLFDIVHKWNLPDTTISELLYYKLQSIPAHSLNSWLRHDSGLLGREKQNILFVPIYQNTSRQQILIDAKHCQGARYYLSFRATKDGTAIVLIQRANSNESTKQQC